MYICILGPEDDPNAEILHWLQLIDLTLNVYMKPFTLSASLLPSLSQNENENDTDDKKEDGYERLLLQLQRERPEYKWHIEGIISKRDKL